VIVAAGGPISAVRARHRTTTIPIVFTTVAEPIKYGLVDSLPNTTTNATGTAGLTTELDQKRLELLKELLPNLISGTVGVLVNPNRPRGDVQWQALSDAATAMRLTLAPPAKAGTESDLNAAFRQLRGVTALLVTADPFFNSRRKKVLDHAKQLAVPAIYQWREFAEEGGLMSYGTSIVDAYELAGNYVGRILRDHLQPPQLPPVHVIDQSELNPVINLGTAEDLLLDIPYPLLARSELIGDD
jgi:putative ABC transport system substrate-binding protein